MGFGFRSGGLGSRVYDFGLRKLRVSRFLGLYAGFGLGLSFGDDSGLKLRLGFKVKGV